MGTADTEDFPDTVQQSRTSGLTVEIPLDKVAVGNLTKLLDAKGSLIKKALGVQNIGIEILKDRVAFPWFEELPGFRCGPGLHPLPFRTLRDEQKCQTGDGDRKGCGE